jgi:hypothetical protein
VDAVPGKVNHSMGVVATEPIEIKIMENAVNKLPIKIAILEVDLLSNPEVTTIKRAAANGAKTRRCNHIREVLRK